MNQERAHGGGGGVTRCFGSRYEVRIPDKWRRTAEEPEGLVCYFCWIKKSYAEPNLGFASPPLQDFPTNSTQPNMKNTPSLLVRGRLSKMAAFLLLLISATCLAVADDTKTKEETPSAPNPDQTQPTKAATEEKTVILDKFTVKAINDGHRYGPRRSNSAARILQDFQSVPQSIVSLPKELIQDTMAYRLEDVIKFAGGANRGPNANGDNYVIRGLSSVTSTATVDGFTTPGSTDRDMFFFERVDVLKGPAAILLPTGQAGGTINYITKNPESQFSGYFRAQVGAYDANRAEVDVTGPTLNGRVDYRFGAAYHDAQGYHDQAFRKKKLFLGGLTFHLSESTDFTWKIFSEQFRGGTDLGFIVASDTLEYPTSIPRNFAQEPDGAIWNQDRFQSTGTLVTKINSWLTTRLALNYSESEVLAIGSSGVYQYLGGIPVGTKVLTNGATNYAKPDDRNLDLQNDFIAYTKTGSVAQTITFGYALENARNITEQRNKTNNVTDLDLARPTRPVMINKDTTTWPFITGVGKVESESKRFRAYLTDSVSIKDKLILSGSVSWNSSNGTSKNYALSDDKLSILPTGQTITDTSSNSETLINYGIVYKIMPLVSLFYGHNELVNFNNAVNPFTGQLAPNTGARQDEIGVKAILMGGDLQFSIAGYQIKQEGSPTVDLLTRSFIIRPPRTSEGFDIDATYQVGKKLSIIAAYGQVNAKTALGGRALGVPKQTIRAWAMISGPVEVLRDFRFGLGIDYTSDRLGDLFNELGRFGGSFLPKDKPFMLPAYTTFDALIAYSRKNSKIEYSVKFNNITNEKYFRQSTVPYAAVTAPDFNILANVTYRF